MVSAGNAPTIEVGSPGDQGAVITGVQAIGVSTPSAAVVAAATAGLTIEVHSPKGGMFNIGTLSPMLAVGNPPVWTRLVGSTVRVDGKSPKLHWMLAVAVTTGGTRSRYRNRTDRVFGTFDPRLRMSGHAFARKSHPVASAGSRDRAE